MVLQNSNAAVADGCFFCCPSFFFQAEDGIRDFCLSRGLGDVYKRQIVVHARAAAAISQRQQRMQMQLLMHLQVTRHRLRLL